MKKMMVLLLFGASASASAFEEDASLFCGRLQGTSYRHAITFTCGASFGYGFNDWFALNVVYLNEGHPENHHRDGFAVQPSVYRDFGAFRVQLAAGPYYTMDTTRQDDGTLLNDKKLGWLSSLTLKWHPPGRSWHVGIGYNNVTMPNSLNSNSVVVSVGIDAPKDAPAEERSGSPIEVGLWVGPGDTTNPGTKVKTAGQLELEFPFRDQFSYSIAALYEGNTTLADRKGLMAQAWYNTDFRRWTFGVGAGPYLERDALREGGGIAVLAVASIRATYRLTRRTDVGLNFNRVISFYNRDADIFMLGLQRAF